MWVRIIVVSKGGCFDFSWLLIAGGPGPPTAIYSLRG